MPGIFQKRPKGGDTTTDMIMNWLQLLHPRRLGKPAPAATADNRNAFQRDFDRIIFSSAFRRLQDKTQVFPLSESDYVRTRLTHSLEASCVGRSLGEMAGAGLLRHGVPLPDGFHPSQTGAIVAAASLAHDIGNPPFGHTGESAIAHWFNADPAGQEVIAGLRKENACAEDFLQFEGNAQGFRVLTRLQHAENHGGMQLTLPTLAAFMKYPRGATLPQRPPAAHKSVKKHGFFRCDAELYEEVAAGLALLRRDAPEPVYARHPLAFLVEAADDICYHVADLEDGFRLKLLTEDETAGALERVISPAGKPRAGGQVRTGQARIEHLRAQAIGALVEQAAEAFLQHHDAILAGTFDDALVEHIPAAEAFGRLFDLAKEKVYPARQVLLIEVAGFNVLGRLVELFLGAMNERAAKGKTASLKTDRVLRLLPAQFLAAGDGDIGRMSLYERTLAATDFVSCMTDTYAVALFKKLTGISLPGE